MQRKTIRLSRFHASAQRAEEMVKNTADAPSAVTPQVKRLATNTWPIGDSPLKKASTPL